MFTSKPSTLKNKRAAYQTGVLAEWICRLWLMAKFYRIYGLRYKTKVGEVDLIAARGNHLIFIEVKSHKSYEKSLNSVTPHQQRRIFNTAQWFLNSHPQFSNHYVRFDVMVVHPVFSTLPFLKKITHIKNAFGETS